MQLERHSADVLVIGGGIAGAFAALHARQAGAEVLLVDKEYFGRSGCSALASGVQHVYMPDEDNLDDWVKAWGGPLVNLSLARAAIQQTHAVYRRMDAAGVKWIKHGGKLLRVQSGGAGSALAMNGMLGGGGPQMMMALRAAVLQAGIRVVDRVMVTDLLTSDGRLPTRGRVVGAIGLNYRTGTIHLFQARAVIMCAGPLRFPYSSRPGKGLPGMPFGQAANGIAMLLRVGAVLGKLEFGGHSLTPAEFWCAPGLEMLGGLGGRFVDREGRDILASDTLTREDGFVSRRSSLSLAITRHLETKKEPVYLDCRHFTPEQFRLLRQVIPIVMGNYELGGYDLARDLVPYVSLLPGTNGVAGGGAAINGRGETSVPGLYAAGGNTDGAYVSMGQQLAACAVLGCWAGDAAGAAVGGQGLADPVPAQVEALAAALDGPLARGADGYGQLQAEVEAILADTVGRMMSDERLGRAREQLRPVVERLPNCGAADLHGLMKLIGFQNYCQALDVSLGVMIRRQESRGNFVKLEHMYTDNSNWLSYTRAQLQPDGSLRLWEEPRPDTADYLPVARTRELHAFFGRGQA